MKLKLRIMKFMRVKDKDGKKSKFLELEAQ